MYRDFLCGHKPRSVTVVFLTVLYRQPLRHIQHCLTVRRKHRQRFHIRHRLRCSRELAADLLPGRNGIRILHRPGFRRSHLMAAEQYIYARRQGRWSGRHRPVHCHRPGSGLRLHSGWIIKVAVGPAGIAGTGACAVFQITHNNKNLTLS